MVALQWLNTTHVDVNAAHDVQWWSTFMGVFTPVTGIHYKACRKCATGFVRDGTCGTKRRLKGSQMLL